MSGVPVRMTDGFPLLSMNHVFDANPTPSIAPELLAVYQSIGGWIRSYLMSADTDLGRPGDVCPFTAQASRLDTIRIGVSDATGSDVSGIASVMRDYCRQLRFIPCPATLHHFRTIVVGFPAIHDKNGLKSLQTVQAKLRFHALVRGLMIGRFYAQSNDPGLWNPDFRPLRSPIPLLAIRYLVENDAPFVMRHPLLLPTYLAKFPVTGSKRLMACIAKTLRSNVQPPAL